MNIKAIMKIKNWLTKNKILNERRKKINVVNKKIRLLESELLDPEYAYLKIDNNGYLVNGYPIPMAMSFTKDKVESAAFAYGYTLMDKYPNMGWAAAYIARNDINQRVGRKKIFSDKEICECLERYSADTCDEIYEYLEIERKEWEFVRKEQLAKMKALRRKRFMLAPVEEFFY